MQTFPEINFWPHIKLLELFIRTGGASSTHKHLRKILLQTMYRDNACLLKKLKKKKTHTDALSIMMHELEIRDTSILLTAILHNLSTKDIFSSLQIANLFGDDICYMVEMLTVRKFCIQGNHSFYTQLINSFNTPISGKTRQQIAIISIIIMADYLRALRRIEEQNHLDPLNFRNSLVNFFNLYIIKFRSFDIPEDYSELFHRTLKLLENQIMQSSGSIFSGIPICSEMTVSASPS